MLVEAPIRTLASVAGPVVAAVPVAAVSVSVVVPAVGDSAGAALVEVTAGAAEVAVFTTAGLAVSPVTGTGSVGACVAAAGAQAAKTKAKTTPKKGILLISFSLQT